MGRLRILAAAVLAVYMPAVTPPAHSQTSASAGPAWTVSYVTTRSVYFRAGSEQGVVVGDTLVVRKGDSTVAVVHVEGVSAKSSVAGILEQTSAVSIGDAVAPRQSQAAKRRVTPDAPRTEPPAPILASRSESTNANRVSGRIALQAVGSTSPQWEDPSLRTGILLRLNIDRLFGSGVHFRVYGRGDRQVSGPPRFGLTPAGVDMRVYALEISYDDTRSWFGFNAGRIISPYVGGLGAFDGGQAYVRAGPTTVGFLLGTQPDFVTSEFRTEQQKGAFFANLEWDAGNDVTVAYAAQKSRGKLDRDHLYFQNTVRSIPGLRIYHSMELDLHRADGEGMKSDFHLTNTFLSASYTPVQWVTVNAGYDATRTIYLMESMKTIPDTLRDEHLHQGLRGSVLFRLPFRATLSGLVSARFPVAGTPGGFTAGGRMYFQNVLRTPVSLGMRYSHINGMYAEGDDIALDIDTWLASSLSASFRADRFDHTLRAFQTRVITTTAGMALNWSLFRSLYAGLNLDHIWEDRTRMVRGYFEVGVQF